MTINGTRFYKPTLASLTKGEGRELMFARKSLDEAYQMGSEFDVPDFDFSAPDTKRPIMTRRITMQEFKRPEDFKPEYFDLGPFQITYKFSSAARKNIFPVKSALPFTSGIKKEYGAPGWSFRMLYEFLCTAYNGNVPFIDTYFDKVFKTRKAHERLLSYYNDVQDDINNEQFDLFMRLPLKADGAPDMRYAESKKFMDFKVWKDKAKKLAAERLGAEIRADIEACLSTGRLPLRGRTGAVISPSAKRLCDALGGMAHPDRLFYVSGQLIRHLKIFVEIGDRAA